MKKDLLSQPDNVETKHIQTNHHEGLCNHQIVLCSSSICPSSIQEKMRHFIEISLVKHQSSKLAGNFDVLEKVVALH